MGRKDKSRYEWLQEYLDLEERCRYLRWQIRKVKREEQRWEDGDLSHLRINGRSRGAHVLDQLQPLQAELDDCEGDRQELLALVDSFHGYEHEFLKLHYIEGMTLDDIADDPDFPYGIDWIYKKSSELHKRLDFLDEWEAKKQSFENRFDVEVGDCIPLF